MSHTNNSKLDFQQIIKAVFDSDKHRLRTDGIVSFEGGEQEIIISHLDDSIRLGDGTNFLTSTNIGADYGLDVNIIGGSLTSSDGGLIGGLANSAVNITDTPTKIPVSALTDRHSISIRNWGTSNIYFGTSSVSTSNGYPKRPYEEFVLRAGDAAATEIYAVCESGESSQVRVIEIA